MIPVRFYRAAEFEYFSAVDWYTSKSSELADKFVTSVHSMLHQIANQPERYPENEWGVREALLIKWPYCIYYINESVYISVIAVFHLSRDPKVWQSRI